MKNSVKIGTVSILLVMGFSTVIFSDSSSIPSWIKNNAGWWADGQITELEYISSLQYLVNQGVLTIPITEVTASSPVTDDERAHSFVVHFSDGLISKPTTISTFSKFEITSSDTDEERGTLQIYKFSDTPKFYLESLPSIDKKDLYEGVDRWMNKNAGIKPFDVNIDVISGDGRIIQTWKFSTCDLTGYGTYLQDIKNLYQFSNDNDGAEIRDRATFTCQGVKLIT